MIKPQIVNKLKSINELQLLTHIAKKEDWQHSNLTRKNLAELYDVAEVTIKKNLFKLLQKTLIEKVSKGVYRINKEILQ